MYETEKSVYTTQGGFLATECSEVPVTCIVSKRPPTTPLHNVPCEVTFVEF